MTIFGECMSPICDNNCYYNTIENANAIDETNLDEDVSMDSREGKWVLYSMHTLLIHAFYYQ